VRLPDIVVDPSRQWPEVLVDPPLIVIEVLSPNDPYAEVQRLVQDYLDMGMKNIWLIDTETQSGRVCNGIEWTAVKRFEIPGRAIYLDLEEQFERLHRYDSTPHDRRELRRRNNDEPRVNDRSIFESEANLRQAGFEGFVSIRDLRLDQTQMPAVSGVYLVVHRFAGSPIFGNPGMGGWFKGQDPNLDVEILESRWIEKTPVVYVGRAGGADKKSTLRSRWQTRLRFGAGRPVGAWGGRLIWQLREAEDLCVCWKRTEKPTPAELKNTLLEMFNEGFGRNPFANLG
jgi:hypothetical protein